jgi:cell division protein FtsW (lipid II flippase)
LYGWNESVAVFQAFRRFSGPIPDITREIVAGTFVAVAILTIFLAFMAQPVLRNIGFCLGVIGSALAVLILPVSLVTFPNGLSASILLTDPATRKLFTPNPTKPD